jgi:hypothetical protein
MRGRYFLHADPKLIERAFGSRAGHRPLGSDPRLGQGPCHRQPDDQRPSGRHHRQVGLPLPPLHRAGIGLLRVAAAGQGTQAALLIRRREREPIGFAGLWESWEDRGTGEVVETSSSLRAR